jgi:outer membrane beta-barrel protein
MLAKHVQRPRAMRASRTPDRVCAVVAVVAFFAALPCAAQEVVYGPDGAPTVVQRKKHRLTGRWETALLVGRGLNGALVDHTGLLLEGAYHPNEWLDLGLGVLANSTGLTTLADQVRSRLPPRTVSGAGSPGAIGADFTGESQLRVGALAQARLAPIYGKINLASELAVHFQAFVLVGAGAGYVRHESVNLCADGGSSACQPGRFQTDDAVRPLGEVGLGLRFFLGQHASLETELRAFVHPDRIKENVDLTNPASGTSRTVLAVLPTLLVGVSVVY